MAARSDERPDRSPTAEISVRLLGQVLVRCNGQILDLPGRPALALMVLIALHRSRLSRDTIATEIWPEAGFGSSARLRQALWLVRRAVSSVGVDPDRVLAVDDHSIGLHDHVQVVADVTRFETLLRKHPPDLERALGLYPDDVTESLRLESLNARREQLADLYEDLLASIAAKRLAAGDLDGARDAAVQLLARDPLREEAHATLIELYGRRGSRSQVYRQYQRLRAVLARELQAEPLAETDALFHDALARIEEQSAARAHR